MADEKPKVSGVLKTRAYLFLVRVRGVARTRKCADGLIFNEKYRAQWINTVTAASETPEGDV